MGNAKRRRLEFFESHPHCCFCAGKRPAAEEEHIPPRIMFIKKHRPKGFEFPTCLECNRASRKTDEVVSFLAKFAVYRDDLEELQSEFDKQARAVLRNCPESFDEILSGRTGNRTLEKNFRRKFGLDASISTVGPKQRQHLNLFAIKLTAAAYYKIKSDFLKENDKISVRILTQHSTLTHPPIEELNQLGIFSTLEMGTWRVPDQFSYRWAHDANVEIAAFEFVFHQNLRLVTFVFRDGAPTPSADENEHFFTISDIQPVTENLPMFPTITKSYIIPSAQ